MECALKTSPNVVIVSEESAARGEALSDVVSNLCDVVQARAAKGMNYGCIIIPEGLVLNLPAVKTLIDEINALFGGITDPQEFKAMKEKLLNEEELKPLLSAWSYGLYSSLPTFTKQQLCVDREMAGQLKLSQLETEKLLAYLCDQELKKRKAKGTYSGAFAPVTHFFGYQGRSAHPSQFDCNLGSTYGFAAGVLIENGLSGQAVSVLELTEEAKNWRVGGVPLLALLQCPPKPGHTGQELAVPSELVDLQGRIYQVLKPLTHKWRSEDHYTNPGPIQYAMPRLTRDMT